MQPAKRITVAGKPWRLVFQSRHRLTETAKSHGITVRADGLCDWDARTIFVYDKLAGKDLIDTLIHEFLHGVRSDCNEEWVTTVASELSAILFDVMQYRGPGDGEFEPARKKAGS
jgi:hypothetical protein